MFLQMAYYVIENRTLQGHRGSYKTTSITVDYIEGQEPDDCPDSAAFD